MSTEALETIAFNMDIWTITSIITTQKSRTFTGLFNKIANCLKIVLVRRMQTDFSLTFYYTWWKIRDRERERKASS